MFLPQRKVTALAHFIS